MGDARADLEAGLSPEELIPGNIKGIQNAATNAGGFGNQLALTVRGVKYLRINGQDWTGRAYDAYALAADLHVSDLQNATTAFDDAATALLTYAQVLANAREQAADARRRYLAAKRAIDNDPTKTVHGLLTTPPTAGPPAPFTLRFDDNGNLELPNDPLTAAVSQLETARKNVKSGAADLAKTLKSATENAPKPKSHHDNWKDRLKDIGTGTLHDLKTIGESPFKLVLDTDAKHINWGDVGKDLFGTLALGSLFLPDGGSDIPEEPLFPQSGGPKVIDEGDVASITARLQSHVNIGIQLYKDGYIAMTDKQLYRLGTDPGLEDAFRGQVIDKYVKDAVRKDPSLNKILWVSRSGEFGPDFHSIKTNTWWDVTTPGQWTRHVGKYKDPFGSGIGLFTK